MCIRDSKWGALLHDLQSGVRVDVMLGVGHDVFMLRSGQVLPCSCSWCAYHYEQLLVVVDAVHDRIGIDRTRWDLCELHCTISRSGV